MDRVEVSRRLKAARALRGLKVTDLAQLAPLVRNGITANLVGETERQERDAREMELRIIAEALEMPPTFFLAVDPFEREVYEQDIRELLHKQSELLETIRGLVGTLTQPENLAQLVLDAAAQVAGHEPPGPS